MPILLGTTETLCVNRKCETAFYKQHFIYDEILIIKYDKDCVVSWPEYWLKYPDIYFGHFISPAIRLIWRTGTIKF